MKYEDKDVTICIPYFERRDALLKTLKSFRQSEYRAAISIVDDGSMREPVPFIKDACVMHLPKKPDWRNPCVPLNRAVKNSYTPLILLNGPDIVHDKGLLYGMLDMMNKHEEDHLAVLADTKRVPKAPFWWCQLMTRAFFDEVKGFDEAFRKGKGGEDTDFYNRCALAGGKYIRIIGPPFARRIPLAGTAKWTPHPYKTGQKGEPNCELLIKRYGQTQHLRRRDIERNRAENRH
jgi:glycosyltransferase involved in cell wall biosynthesis